MPVGRRVLPGQEKQAHRSLKFFDRDYCVVFIVEQDFDLGDAALRIERDFGNRAVSAVRLDDRCNYRVSRHLSTDHERRIASQVEFEVICPDPRKQ